MDRPIMPPRPVPVDKHVYGEVSFWCKKGEEWLARTKRLTVFIRPGDRSNPDTLQYVPELEPVPVFFLRKEGSAETNTPPEIYLDDGTTVEVVRRVVKPLGEVDDTDLVYAGGVAVPRSAAEVRDYLEYEMSPGKKFGDADLVTLYRVRYLSKAF